MTLVLKWLNKFVPIHDCTCLLVWMCIYTNENQISRIYTLTPFSSFVFFLYSFFISITCLVIQNKLGKILGRIFGWNLADLALWVVYFGGSLYLNTKKLIIYLPFLNQIPLKTQKLPHPRKEKNQISSLCSSF